MRIGIESCTWSNRRGYGRFIRGLVGSMLRRFPEHEYVLVLDQATAAESVFPARASLEVVITSEQQTRAASADGSRRPRDLWRLSRAVARARFDVFWFPTRYSFYPMTCRTPTVVTFHDATAENHPELIFDHARARLLWWIKSRLALAQADRLVTVSEDARRQIASRFRYQAERIQVITEGPDEVFRKAADPHAAAEVRARLRLPPELPLVLYVGGISPHKNLQTLLRSLTQVPGAWHAVLVGDYQNDSFLGCYHELRDLARELGIGERVTFAGYVEDPDLAVLYNTAALLVLPSMGEGFGLPVVEAMACGLPVAASARSSLPEVLGEAGILFDPESPAEISAAITRLLQDPDLRAEFGRAGLARAASFSWDRGAEILMEVLEDAARA